MRCELAIDLVPIGLQPLPVTSTRTHGLLEGSGTSTSVLTSLLKRNKPILRGYTIVRRRPCACGREPRAGAVEENPAYPVAVRYGCQNALASDVQSLKMSGGRRVPVAANEHVEEVER